MCQWYLGRLTKNETFMHKLSEKKILHTVLHRTAAAAAAAKSLQSCTTLCDPIDGSPPGSPVPGILQARTLEWLPFPSPMHESEKWKRSHSVVSDSSRPHGLQPTRLLRPWGFPGKSTGVGCHRLLHSYVQIYPKEYIQTEGQYCD